MPMPSTLKSKLLANLFWRLEQNKRLTVLDVGAASPETVDFFSQFKCRLYFADLLAEPIPCNAEEETRPAVLQEHFTSVLNLPNSTKLDICLFWDCLNYLDQRSLYAFGNALRPYLHDDSQAHGFGVINSRTTLENRQYGIQNTTALTSKRKLEPQPPYYPHPQKELNEKLDCMVINKGILMADGRLEVLLKANINKG